MNINQIAEICGVSKKTVSRVINNDPNVKKETRERILETMRKHNYRPSIFARNLGRKTVSTLLISIRRARAFENTIWVEQLLKEVVDEAQKHGFRVLIESYYGDFDETTSALSEGGFVDAMVLFYEEETDRRIELADKFGIPLVVFGQSQHQVSCIGNKNDTAMEEAFMFLISKGLIRNTLLLGDKLRTNLQRLKGAEQAYRNMNIDPSLLNVIWEINSPARVYEIVENDIRKGTLPEAYFISGDQKALGAYGALYKHSIRIPDEVSIIGFDDISISQCLAPPLSTVAQDFHLLAEKLMEMVLQLIDNPNKLLIQEVPAKLVIRESTPN